MPAARALFALCAWIDGGVQSYVGAEEGSEAFYRAVLHWREVLPALREGTCDYTVIGASSDAVFAPLRRSADQYVVPVIYLGEGAARVTLIDAPICNGSVRGAYSRQITLCVGGDPAALDRVRSILAHVASNIIHVGPLGSGHAVKIINNSISAAVDTVVAEGIALGEAFGLERGRLVSILSQCSTSKASFERAAANYLRQPHQPQQPGDGVTFQLYLMAKDLRYATVLAGELGSPHPVTDAAHGLFEIAERVLGLGAESSSAPSQLLQQLGSRARPSETR